jgi:hypothetical protein
MSSITRYIPGTAATDKAVAKPGSLTFTEDLGDYQTVLNVEADSIGHNSGIDGILYRSQRLSDSIKNPTAFLDAKNAALYDLSQQLKDAYKKIFSDLYKTGMSASQSRELAMAQIESMEISGLAVINTRFPSDVIGGALGVKVSETRSQNNNQLANMIALAPTTVTKKKTTTRKKAATKK